jgi:CubicO group peptidase (beta-lactamase class C family)
VSASFAELLDETLPRQLATHHVTGAAVGVMHGDQEYIVCAGGADATSRRPVTERTPFLIGSVAKTWTATLVMQLVESGKLALDDPVTLHIPNLALATRQATRALTVRHLLTHASGIDEEVAAAAADSSDGCLSSYVARLGHLGQIHAPGETFSYSNSGFVIAGLIAERIVGAVYEDALSDLLIDPLRLEDTFFVGRGDPRPTVVGYRTGWRGQPVATRDRLPRAYGPAGSTVAASVRDVLRFARLHLASPNDRAAAQVLGASARSHMQRTDRHLPWARTPAEGSMGLGWMRCALGPYDVLYHGGGNIGQQCGLLLVPSARLAIATLTNAHTCPGLHSAIIDLALSELLAVKDGFAPTRVSCDDGTTDGRDCVGRYERRSLGVEVSERNGSLRSRVTRQSDDVRMGTTASPLAIALQRLFGARLTPCRDGTFIARRSGSASTNGTPFVFRPRVDHGPVEHLQIGYSALRRVRPGT